MKTKHDQILSHIEKLPVGVKISVRGIAKELNVSEGTAYRAIKEAETNGLVSTIQRVGTIRIERKMTEGIEKLTFEEVAKVIEGDILAGYKGLHKVLNKFVIGAMTEKNMLRYIAPGSLMIVGDRTEVQRLALKQGAAVLLTGGFDVDADILELADEVALPILRTAYDTFTVATMINRAISDQLIKKDIMLVGDIQTDVSETDYLYLKDTIADYRRLTDETGHSRFPIVNRSQRLVGVVTSKDIIGKLDNQPIEKVMTRNPRRVKEHMSVASVAHMMIWEGLEMMPVVADDLMLLGIVSRQDVMKAMQIAQKQPQMANTIADQIAAEIIEKELSSHPLTSDAIFNVTVTPQMVNNMGTIAFGVLNQIVASVTQRVMFNYQKRNVVIEQVSMYYLKLIQIESNIEVKPHVIEIGRRSAKVDVEIYIENIIVAKALVVCQLMEKT